MGKALGREIEVLGIEMAVGLAVEKELRVALYFVVEV